jgi:hypothetical protein
MSARSCGPRSSMWGNIHGEEFKKLVGGALQYKVRVVGLDVCERDKRNDY